MSWTRAMVSPGRWTARFNGGLRSGFWHPRARITEIDAQRQYADKVIDAVRDPLLVLDADLAIRRANPAFYELFALKPSEAIGRKIFDLGNGQWENAALRCLLEDILRRKDLVEDFVIDHIFPKLGHRVMLLSAQRVDHFQFILLTIEDVTGSREAQRQQEILVAELNHRVKNTLATVQGLLTQTVRQASSLEQLEESLVGRLKALSRGHEILVDVCWQRSDLAELIDNALKPYGCADRISIDCETIHLPPQALLAFNLILHELATNAVKFGALSLNSGRVHIKCRLDPARPKQAQFTWSESGGPRIASGQIQPGFGMKLVERSAEHELFGEADLKFEPEGMRCSIRFATEMMHVGRAND